MRDKYTIKQILLTQVENGGWMARHEATVLGAFTTNEDLMDWLNDNLHDADIVCSVEKQECAE